MFANVTRHVAIYSLMSRTSGGERSAHSGPRERAGIQTQRWTRTLKLSNKQNTREIILKTLIHKYTDYKYNSKRKNKNKYKTFHAYCGHKIILS